VWKYFQISSGIAPISRVSASGRTGLLCMNMGSRSDHQVHFGTLQFCEIFEQDPVLIIRIFINGVHHNKDLGKFCKARAEYFKNFFYRWCSALLLVLHIYVFCDGVDIPAIYKLSPESYQKLRWCLVVGFFVVQINACDTNIFVLGLGIEMVHNN
jgi:hypothetical protein